MAALTEPNASVLALKVLKDQISSIIPHLRSSNFASKLALIDDAIPNAVLRELLPILPNVIPAYVELCTDCTRLAVGGRIVLR
jgi:hypothetical protein